MKPIFFAIAMMGAFSVTAQAAALPSRYDVIDKSLESFLNEGWMIVEAFASQRLDGVIIEQNGKYVHCKLSNLYRSSGMSLQSECFFLN